MSDPGLIPNKADNAVSDSDGIRFEDFVRCYEGQAVEWHAGKVVQNVSKNPQHNFIVFFIAQLLSFYLLRVRHWSN